MMSSIKEQIFEVLRSNRVPMSPSSIAKYIGETNYNVKKGITELEMEEQIQLVGTFYVQQGNGLPYYTIKDPAVRYSINEFDVKDCIDQPIWDNVWKEWLILYRHPDYRDLYLQRTNNESLEFIYVKDRYYTNKIEE